MTILAVRMDKITTSINLLHLLSKIKEKYKKIIIYYTGHGVNSGDNFPIITLRDYALSTFSLHKYVEEFFGFSVIIIDCCNNEPARGDIAICKEIVKPKKPFTIEELEQIMDNRGHLLISSARKGEHAFGYKHFGGIFSQSFFSYLVKHNAWTRAFHATSKLLEKYYFKQRPHYFGYIFSQLIRYEKETDHLYEQLFLQKGRTRSPSEEKRIKERERVLNEMENKDKQFSWS